MFYYDILLNVAKTSAFEAFLIKKLTVKNFLKKVVDSEC